ncbi:hypothetical protein H7J83_21450 [Mycobacterium mantenii]|uniref:Uncharacterized protein n=2 Tax=Mycobacterium mantenii TaxID=560555 RepID=A0A1X0FBX0_MYCNT|nr:hypothetical protein [Mycobacterium mantenii]MCV7245263.1 hypothetical protein [Mycobacterium mantenii]ORA99243.1 hypothetical protein BST30_24510 [Mycobacterium mantenii]
MTVAYLASHESGVRAGYLMFWLGVPAIGLVCLVIGLVERSRSRRRAPGYPPQYPPGFPVHPGYPYPPPPGYAAAPYPGYAPGHPPRPRAPKSATALITMGAVLLTLGGLGILGNAARVLAGLGASAIGDTSLRVGDCISESDYKAQHFNSSSSGGCTDPAATYELASRSGAGDTCPDGKREHSVYDRFTNDSTILCFAVNLKEGQCYQMISDGDAMTLRLGDCDKPGRAQVKVSQRIDGSSDKSQCPSDSRGIAYPIPARVYCLVRAD